MKNNIPRGLILEYSRVFGRKPPAQCSRILSGPSKVELLSIVSFIGNKIMPREGRGFDYSLETQYEIIDYLLRLENNNDRKNYLKKYFTRNSIIFNRISNLVAITEIINSNLPYTTESTGINKIENLQFIEFYLCINEKVNEFEFQKNNNDNIDLIELSANFNKSTEYTQLINPFFGFFKGIKLFEYIEYKTEYSHLFSKYIYENTRLSIRDYIKNIISIYFFYHDKPEEKDLYFSIKIAEDSSPLFDYLSKRDNEIKEPNIYENLHIRKAPLFNVNNKVYLVLDPYFLLDKLFTSIIWSFLFDYLIPNKENDNRLKMIKEFRGEIGLFYESYIREIIHPLFMKFYFPALYFNDLFKDGVEFGDIYARKNKKIFIAEVKSSTIPSNQKYGTDLQKLLNSNPNDFYNTHGLRQLITNVNRIIKDEFPFDSFNSKSVYTIFPIIVTNEVNLKTIFFNKFFNDEFKKKIVKSKFFNVKDLLIIHTNDIEILGTLINEGLILDIFDFLNKHLKRYPFPIDIRVSYSRYRYKTPNYIVNSVIDYLRNNH